MGGWGGSVALTQRRTHVLLERRSTHWLKAAGPQNLCSSRMAGPLDYTRIALKSNGLDVTHLTMSGLLAEEAIKLAFKSDTALHMLGQTDLPSQLVLRLDRRGNRRVYTQASDRALGLAVAQDILMKLHNIGLVLVQPVAVVEDDEGEILGAHDLIMKVLCSPTGQAPSDRFPGKLISVELKLRHLWSPRGVADVRKALRRDCESACAWWKREVDTGRFSARMIVLCVFPSLDSHRYQSKAEFKLIGVGEEWKPLWGWPSSRPSLERPLRELQADQREKLQAEAKARAKAQARANAQSRERSIAESHRAAMLDRLVFRSINDKMVAEVKGLMRAAQMADTNASYWCNKVLKCTDASHAWITRDVLFQAERGYTTSVQGVKRKRCGGPQTWFATRPVCAQLLQDWA